MRVIVSGGWSYGNIGDEAIAKATRYELNRIWPEAEYIFLAYNQDEFYKHHKIESHPSVHRLINNASDLKLNQGNVEEKLEELKTSVFASYTSLFGKEDTVFVMSGGGYFHEGWEDQFLSRIIEILIAASMKAKIFVVGQSMGPFYSDRARALVVKALKKCTYINVRDVSSYEMIKSLDKDIVVKRSCDIANDITSCYPSKAPVPKRQSKKIISMMLSGYSHYQMADERIEINKTLLKIISRITLRKSLYDYRIRSIVKYFGKREDCYIQIVMSTDWLFDKKFINRMMRGLDPAKYRIVSQATVDQLCGAIMTSDYMISSKMHPLIIANSFGIPTIGISYNFKVDDFMESIGRGKYCFINRKFRVKDVLRAFDEQENLNDFSTMAVSLSNNVKELFREMSLYCK